MKICVDMGHTPTSPGAGKYLNELAEDRKIGNALIAELQRRGHTVVNTTPADSVGYPAEINQRIATANRSGADLFCSVHLNAGGGTGTECLYYDGDGTGLAIARVISANIAKVLGLPDRGPKGRTNEVGVIRDTVMTAVLAEVCFVDSTADAAAYGKVSTAAIASAIADGLEKKATSGGSSSGSGSASGGGSIAGSILKPLGNVDVFYALHTKNGNWLPEVKNFGPGDNGFAGIPFGNHDFLYIHASFGTVKYRVHTLEDGWLPFVTRGEKNDTVNGCAGIAGHTIDGVEAYYITPSGYQYKQIWYQAQTTARSGYQGVVCDDGTSIAGYTDTYAGIYGEPLDRLQMAISDHNPF